MILYKADRSCWLGFRDGQSPRLRWPPCDADEASGVHKGGFSKGGFSNNNMIITHKLLTPLY